MQEKGSKLAITSQKKKPNEGLVYELSFDPVAIDELNKLEFGVKKCIFEKLRDSKQNPYHYFDRLVGRIEYKLHVGDYRVIVDICNSRITVLHVVHRKNVYE